MLSLTHASEWHWRICISHVVIDRFWGTIIEYTFTISISVMVNIKVRLRKVHQVHIEYKPALVSCGFKRGRGYSIVAPFFVISLVLLTHENSD